MVEKTEETQAPRPKKERFWLVPRNNMDLYHMLINSGYETEVINEQESIYKRGSRLSELDLCLGELINKDKITLKYEVSNRDQIGNVLELRELLDINEISYIEEPSRQELIKIVKEDTDSLIKRIAGN